MIPQLCGTPCTGPHLDLVLHYKESSLNAIYHTSQDLLTASANSDPKEAISERILKLTRTTWIEQYAQ